MLVEAPKPPEPTLASAGDGELRTRARPDDLSAAWPSCCEDCCRLTRAVKSDELSLMDRGAAAVVANGLRLQQIQREGDEGQHQSAQNNKKSSLNS